MTIAERQAGEEMAVFRRFAETVWIPIDVGSIENRNPPEPDILCHISGEGRVGFELVELIDVDLARDVNVKIQLERELCDTLEHLQEGPKKAYEERFGDTLVSVWPMPGLTTRRVREALPLVFGHLLSGDRDTRGLQQLGAGLREVFSRIDVVRDCPGPAFDVQVGATAFDSPIHEGFERKFSKTYDNTHPLELLAYHALQPMMPGWHEKLRNYVPTVLPGSPFRRIWVFRFDPPGVLWVEPPELRRNPP